MRKNYKEIFKALECIANEMSINANEMPIFLKDLFKTY